jgi:hypothetical protein
MCGHPFASDLGMVKMNLVESLAVLVASLALLFFGARTQAHSLLRKFPWVAGQMFAMTIWWLFAAGLMGIAVNLNWLR